MAFLVHLSSCFLFFSFLFNFSFYFIFSFFFSFSIFVENPETLNDSTPHPSRRPPGGVGEVRQIEVERERVEGGGFKVWKRFIGEGSKPPCSTSVH